jgi:hypothetical protein
LQCGLAVVNGTEDVSGINKYAMMVCLIGKREAGDHRKDFHHQKRLQNVAPAFAPGCRSPLSLGHRVERKRAMP